MKKIYNKEAKPFETSSTEGVSVASRMHRRALELILTTGGGAGGYCVAPFYFLLSKLSNCSNRNVRHEWLEETIWQGQRLRREHNYLQIFKKSVRRMNDPQDQAYSLYKKIIEMSRDFELAFLYGQRTEDLQSDPGIEDADHTHVPATYLRRTMGGLAFFGQHVTETRPFIVDGAVNSDVTSRVWNTPGSRFAFVPGNIYGGMTNSDRMVLVPTDRTYGIPVKQSLSGGGTLDVIEDPMLMEHQDVFIVNFGGGTHFSSKLTRLYLENRDWHANVLPEFYRDVGSPEGGLIRNDNRYVLLCEQGLRVENGSDIHIIHLGGGIEGRPSVAAVEEGSTND